MIRVVATPVSGGQAFVIADGTGQRGPGGRLLIDPTLTGSYDAAVQRVSATRATATRRLDRVNESGQMDLSAEYEFSSEEQTFLWILGLQKAVPRLANLEISTRTGASKLIGNCWIRPMRFQGIGQVAVRVVYPIEFGVIT